MTVHLIKLSVGSDNLDDFETWQTQLLKQQTRAGQKKELMHITRHTPRRGDEVLDNGSIYWVIGGFIVARQRMLELRAVTRGGIASCGLIYGHEIIRVHPRPMRAFQGWRYFETKDAPPDLVIGENDDAMPDHMRQALAMLGLL